VTLMEVDPALKQQFDEKYKQQEKEIIDNYYRDLREIEGNERHRMQEMIEQEKQRVQKEFVKKKEELEATELAKQGIIIDHDKDQKELEETKRTLEEDYQYQQNRLQKELDGQNQTEKQRLELQLKRRRADIVGKKDDCEKEVRLERLKLERKLEEEVQSLRLRLDQKFEREKFALEMNKNEQQRMIKEEYRNMDEDYHTRDDLLKQHNTAKEELSNTQNAILVKDEELSALLRANRRLDLELRDQREVITDLKDRLDNTRPNTGTDPHVGDQMKYFEDEITRCNNEIRALRQQLEDRRSTVTTAPLTTTSPINTVQPDSTLQKLEKDMENIKTMLIQDFSPRKDVTTMGEQKTATVEKSVKAIEVVSDFAADDTLSEPSKSEFETSEETRTLDKLLRDIKKEKIHLKNQLARLTEDRKEVKVDIKRAQRAGTVRAMSKLEDLKTVKAKIDAKMRKLAAGLENIRSLEKWSRQRQDALTGKDVTMSVLSTSSLDFKDSNDESDFYQRWNHVLKDQENAPSGFSTGTGFFEPGRDTSNVGYGSPYRRQATPMQNNFMTGNGGVQNVQPTGYPSLMAAAEMGFPSNFSADKLNAYQPLINRWAQSRNNLRNMFNSHSNWLIHMKEEVNKNIWRSNTFTVEPARHAFGTFI